MKDFMLIFIGVSYEKLGMSPEEMQNRMGRWFAWSQQMEQDGVIRKGGHALQESQRRVVGPEKTVTDKAAPEAKELIGGYYVVQANDIEEATKIAQGYPDYDLGGTVEIREVMVFN